MKAARGERPVPASQDGARRVPALPRAPPPEETQLGTSSRRKSHLQPRRCPELPLLARTGLEKGRRHPASHRTPPQPTAGRPLPFPQSSAAAAAAAPFSQAGPGAHPSLGRSAASPSPPVARQARTQLPPFPARSEAAGGGGTRRPARPPPLAMEGDKVRGRCGPAGEPGEPAGRRPGPAPADTARGAAPPRPFPPGSGRALRRRRWQRGTAAAWPGLFFCPASPCSWAFMPWQSRAFFARPRLAAVARVPGCRISQGIGGGKGKKRPWRSS